MFLDIEALSERQTDMALGAIYKALHGHDGDDEIWQEHPSPMVRRIVEMFTERGLERFKTARDELVAWLEGERKFDNEISVIFEIAFKRHFFLQ